MPGRRLTRKRVETFLDVFEQTGNVTEACRIVGCSRNAVYAARKRDPKFAEAWEEREALAVDNLVAEARRRAMSGSDTLLIFLLKNLDKETFGDKHVHEHNHSGSVSHSHTHRAVAEQISEFAALVGEDEPGGEDAQPALPVPD